MMKTIKIIKVTILILLFQIATAYSQERKGYEMPKLNVTEKIYELEFSPDREHTSILTSYMEGETTADSLKFFAKISPTLERTIVTVLTEDKTENITVDIVKKNWNDVQRSGTTKKGAFQETFDTAENFGVILSSPKPGVKFYLAVWRTGEILPQLKPLFFDATKGQRAVNPSQVDENKGQGDNSEAGISVLTWIIIGLLLAIILLLLILVKKKRKSASFLIFLFTMIAFTPGYSQSSSRPRQSSAANFAKVMEKVYENMNQLKDLAEMQELLAKQVLSFDKLLDAMNDKMSQIDLDPAGQPSLPSSCIAMADPSNYSSNQSNTNRENNNTEQYTEEYSSEDNSYENRRDSDGNSSNSESSNNASEMHSSSTYESKENATDDPFTGESSSDTYRRLPKYDNNGNLVNPGDYPDAPVKFDADWIPDLNVFVDLEGRTGEYMRLPKYDDYGNLKNPGDFPDAPIKFDPYWNPENSPFTGESTSGSFDRMPKYDENGNLLDYGDYPQAPKKIDATRINDWEYIMERTRENIYDKGEPKTNDGGTSENGDTSSDSENDSRSTESSEFGTSTQETSQQSNGSSSSSSSNGTNQNGSEQSSGRNSQEDGCDCLERAYSDLNDIRYAFEKLRIISQRMDKQVKAGLEFGDSFSKLTGSGSLGWTYARLRIEKSLVKFDQTYDKKQKEFVKALNKNLMDIDYCERMLGKENWYNESGFIYYEFMKTRYATYK